MSRKLHSFILAALGVCLFAGSIGCDREPAIDDRVLRVGVIASLSGPAKPWGLTTVRCAQVIADYHNERGGFDLGGERVKIELIIRDDAFDAPTAARIAHDFTLDGVNYIIGPVGDATTAAASRVMDGAGAFYVHYGFNQETQSAGSLGVLGMPLPEQSLPVLLRHLRDAQYVDSVLIMAYGSGGGIYQKARAEQVAADLGFDLIQLSRFDVSEETFDSALNSASLRQRVGRVVAVAPDALILVGCPPEAFIVLLDRLRSGGYDGFICTQNFQDPSSLAKLSEASDGVYYVGGTPADELRSDYYAVLKERYLDFAGEWSEEADTKLYAMEFILACIRHAGSDALEDTSVMFRAIQEVRFEDPFFEESQMIEITGGSEDSLLRQIQTPIRISKMSDGQSVIVKEAMSEPL